MEKTTKDKEDASDGGVIPGVLYRTGSGVAGEEKTCFQLPCGHGLLVDKMMAENPEDLLACQVVVVKKYGCGHKFPVECWRSNAREMRDCVHGCYEILECGHTQVSTLKVDENGEPIQFRCRRACEKVCLQGQHRVVHAKPHRCGTPCPPCQMLLEVTLPCGHVTKFRCGEKNPADDPNFKCREKCSRKIPICEHRCKKLCFEDCLPCNLWLQWVVPGCRYRHTNIVECSIGREILKDKATYPCDLKTRSPIKPACGHQAPEVICHTIPSLTPETVALHCEEPCTALLSHCKHPCKSICSECVGGKLHGPCSQKCDRILVCGHVCSAPCGKGCPPCSQLCDRQCDHQYCGRSCGESCNWRCREPCTYECPHGKCSRTCEEICDKVPCKEPCTETLPCGHGCIGFCGEVCPPYCRVCHPEQLAAGSLYSLGEFTDEDKFIFLEGCRHVIESEAMEGILRAKREDDEVMALVCPICRTRLRWMHRYSEVMKRNWEAIEQVKEQRFGDKSLIARILFDVETDLEEVDETLAEGLCPGLLVQLKFNLDPWRRLQLSLHMANTFDWIVSQVRTAVDEVKKLAQYPSKKFMPVDQAIEMWAKFLKLVMRLTRLPVHRNEILDIYCAKQHVMDHVKVCQVLDECCRSPRKEFDSFLDRFSGAAGQELYKLMMKALHVKGQYDEKARENFEKSFHRFTKFIRVTIELGEIERKEIVGAFGAGVGRWFKCRKGHVYVITECGGALVERICPVEGCGGRIGGQQHQLVEDNLVATEMDGAEIGMYDAAVQANRAFFANR